MMLYLVLPLIGAILIFPRWLLSLIYSIVGAFLLSFLLHGCARKKPNSSRKGSKSIINTKSNCVSVIGARSGSQSLKSSKTRLRVLPDELLNKAINEADAMKKSEVEMELAKKASDKFPVKVVSGEQVNKKKSNKPINGSNKKNAKTALPAKIVDGFIPPEGNKNAVGKVSNSIIVLQPDSKKSKEVTIMFVHDNKDYINLEKLQKLKEEAGNF
uniref:Uncharacterized protein n=1 Tax=Parastrongyloides trichosuri TaxID=131310 RepID=A0A0N4ZDP8_PARTI